MVRAILFVAWGVLTVSVATGQEPSSAAAADLALMQGPWVVTEATRSSATTPPALIATLAKTGAQAEIAGNILRLHAAELRAALANDLPLPGEQEAVEQAIRGDRLLMLTLPNGKGCLASYSVSEGQLSIRYPAGACSRTGTVLLLERPRVVSSRHNDPWAIHGGLEKPIPILRSH